jgi:hypothetical protein
LASRLADDGAIVSIRQAKADVAAEDLTVASEMAELMKQRSQREGRVT